MKDNFSKYIERKDTNSVKWDLVSDFFGKDDLLPMWVADSDWPTAPVIQKAIKERAEHGVFGYSFPGDELKRVIVEWVKKHYNWQIKKEWIVFANGVVPSINVAIRALINPGDEVIIQSPVYYPFFSAVENNGARIINNQLSYKKGKYFFAIESLKEQLLDQPKDPARAKALILCSPHNPVGRVWTEKELNELGEICMNNNITVISDEIHADFVYENNQHIPFASISDEFAKNSFTFMAPSKTFNIAGLHSSFAVIPDQELKREFEVNKNGFVGAGNIFGLTAMKAAYEKGDNWLKAQITYLENNMEYAIKYIKNNITGISAKKPEGTYLLWLDCSDLKFKDKNLNDFFVNKANIALDPGSWFGSGGKQFMRMNLACPRSTLEKGLKRIEKAVRSGE